MRITICDNDYDFIKNEMDAIENYCARSNLQVSFDVYISPSNLLATNVKEIQVIFMESVFSNTDGVSLAKQLRSQNRDAIIIFITDNDKCAIHSGFHTTGRISMAGSASRGHAPSRAK